MITQTQNQMIALNGMWGDVTGDGVPDYVYLTAVQEDPTSPYLKQITLRVMDGRTRQLQTIQLSNNAGYQPTIFLGDFTGNHIQDILVSIQSGGSGAFTYNEIYSDVNMQVRQLYNNDWFYDAYSKDATVTYEDNYKVRIVVPALSKQYVIDLSLRDPEYLSELYDDNGKLKKPVQGSVMGVSGAFPIDLQGDGVYELWPFQRVIGLYNADAIGILQTPLTWEANKSMFVPMYQWFAVYGADLK